VRKEQQTSSYSNNVKEIVFVFIWYVKKGTKVKGRGDALQCDDVQGMYWRERIMNEIISEFFSSSYSSRNG